MERHGVQLPLDSIREFCRRNKIRKLALFGSILREDFGPESDVDVLVEYEPEAHVSYFELFDMEEELAALIGGRKVEMSTPRSLSPYFRDRVISGAEVLYAGA